MQRPTSQVRQAQRTFQTDKFEQTMSNLDKNYYSIANIFFEVEDETLGGIAF